MTDRTCSVDGCEGRVKARSWCQRHYVRFRDTGSPTGSKRAKPLDRLLGRCVESPSGCWLWQGSVNNHGYATSSVAMRSVYVHRFVYESLVTDIPAGLVLDHICRTPNCVNPWHLEPVTQRINILRGASPIAGYAARTHCANGHEWNDANTYIRPDTHTRQCRQCANDRARAAKAVRCA